MQIESYTTNQDLKDAIYNFIKMRKSIKATLTDYALKLTLSKLDKLESTDAKKIEILERSIMSSWKGIFALDKDKQIKNTKPGFNNFEARKYDYDDLESKLLGWNE